MLSGQAASIVFDLFQGELVLKPTIYYTRSKHSDRNGQSACFWCGNFLFTVGKNVSQYIITDFSLNFVKVCIFVMQGLIWKFQDSIYQIKSSSGSSFLSIIHHLVTKSPVKKGNNYCSTTSIRKMSADIMIKLWIHLDLCNIKSKLKLLCITSNILTNI